MASRRREGGVSSGSPPKGKLAERYSALVSTRQPFLDRARDCSKITIPTLIPPYPHRTNARYPTPYQSIGARAVNHLSSKLILSLFPPNTPFFRFIVDDLELQAHLGADAATKGTVDEGLAKMERAIVSGFEAAALRVPVFLALKHLIVGGNVLLYVDPKTNKGTVTPISRYVVRRDPAGAVLEIVIWDAMDEDLAPGDAKETEDAQDGREDQEEREDQQSSTAMPSKTVDVYTHVRRCKTRWEVCQEVRGEEVEGTHGSYPLDRCPWLPLRLSAVDGEDYGRGLAEEYYGDLVSLETLTKAMVQFAAAAAKIVFMVKPNSATKPKKLADAQSGDFVQGLRSDVEALQIEKYADFQVTQQVAQEITSRLSYAFLMNSAVQRNAERVTAEEIKLLAQELDAGFGGLYAGLSQELQLPIVQIILDSKQRSGVLPKFPKDMVRPAIVTGIEALGRGNDLQNLQGAIALLSQFPAGLEEIVADELTKRVFSAFNIEPKGLVRTPEQRAAAQQQAALASAGSVASPEALKAAARHVGKTAAENMMPSQQQQQQAGAQ